MTLHERRKAMARWLGRVVVGGVVLMLLGAGVPRALAGQRFFTEAGVGAGLMCDIDLPGDRLWGATLTGQLARQLWKEPARVDLRLEGVVTRYWGKDGAWLGGATVGLRLYNRPQAPAVFAEAAIGPSWNNLDIEEIGSSFNFLSFGGIGLRLEMDEQQMLDIALRVRHISNAGMTERNHGLTSVWVVVSWGWGL